MKSEEEIMAGLANTIDGIPIKGGVRPEIIAQTSIAATLIPILGVLINIRDTLSGLEQEIALIIERGFRGRNGE